MKPGEPVFTTLLVSKSRFQRASGRCLRHLRVWDQGAEAHHRNLAVSVVERQLLQSKIEGLNHGNLSASIFFLRYNPNLGIRCPVAEKEHIQSIEEKMSKVRQSAVLVQAPSWFSPRSMHSQDAQRPSVRVIAYSYRSAIIGSMRMARRAGR